MFKLKFLFFIITIFSSQLSMPTHDVPIAIFHITASDTSLQMDITFDLEDFSESLNIKTNEVSLENMQNYLDENTSFHFNAQVVKLNISDIKIVRDHIKVKGSFGKIAQNIKTIKVENTCLINVSHHSNVIQVDLNNQSKDYRMHKRRTEINLTY